MRVVVIERDAERCEELTYGLDVLTIQGDGTSVETLENAGVAEADMVIASTELGNVGPGFGVVGPMGSYQSFSRVGKILMVALMWIGRLEIIPVLVCLTPEFWRR